MTSERVVEILRAIESNEGGIAYHVDERIAALRIAIDAVQNTTRESMATKTTYYMISIRSLMIDNKWYREPERYRLLSHATAAAKAFPKCREAKIFKVTEEEVA